MEEEIKELKDRIKELEEENNGLKELIDEIGDIGYDIYKKAKY